MRNRRPTQVSPYGQFRPCQHTSLSKSRVQRSFNASLTGTGAYFSLKMKGQRVRNGGRGANTREGWGKREEGLGHLQAVRIYVLIAITGPKESILLLVHTSRLVLNRQTELFLVGISPHTSAHEEGIGDVFPLTVLAPSAHVGPALVHPRTAKPRILWRFFSSLCFGRGHRILLDLECLLPRRPFVTHSKPMKQSAPPVLGCPSGRGTHHLNVIVSGCFIMNIRIQLQVTSNMIISPRRGVRRS